ncbi:hypothetical protein [Rhodococcus sp. OK302]|uniref:hypothetical protein n=1 Tax=Rhodococcus sp. OK302 TaxID=1882769 RepID=UPI000B93F13C|nr:hypothetical protein [Rhodococcus sp. OK302]OYD61294.1 hypothetical protein BDB13_6264 [Rhodococcus sp. OK302]
MSRGAAAVAVGLVVLMSGCSSDDGTADAVQPEDLQPLMLVESDFPAGSQYYRVPDPAAYGRQLADAISNTTFEPADCAQPREEQARIETVAPQAAANAQTTTGDIYVTAVSTGESQPPALVERMFFGPCSTAVTTRTVDGTPVDSTVMVTTRLDPPAGLAADEVIVYRQRAEVRSLLPGDASSPATTLRIVGHAWVGSYRVMLEQTPSDTNTPPREEFDALLRAAVAKLD